MFQINQTLQTSDFCILSKSGGGITDVWRIGMMILGEGIVQKQIFPFLKKF